MLLMSVLYVIQYAHCIYIDNVYMYYTCTFRSIFAAVDDDTIVFVFGDHGMTASGDHGGESEMETTAALLMFTPRPMFDSQQVGRRRRGF